MKKYRIRCYACRKMYESRYPPPERPSDCICQDCALWLGETIANNEAAERATFDNSNAARTDLF